MTIVEHLDELRGRIFWCLAAWLLFSCLFYLFTTKFIEIMTKPIGKLIFFSLAEAFLVKIKLAMAGGIFLAFPVILYHVLQFVLPGLTPKERRFTLLLVPFAILLFLGGAVFSFYYLIPFGIKFLMGFATPQLQPMISIDAYLSFILAAVCVVGLIFELPLVMLFLAKLGIVSSKMLRSSWKYAVLVIFIVASFAAPSPDVFSMFLVAIPMLILYEIGIWLTKLAGR